MKRLLSTLGLIWAVAIVYGQEAEGPRPMTGFADSARFQLYINESVVGNIAYTLDAQGRYQRTFTLSMGGQTAEFTLSLECDAAGLWRTMSIHAPTADLAVTRSGNRAEYTQKEQKYSIQLAPGHILYDNYGPVFESLMIKAYDQKKGGKQTFPRFIIPARMMDVDLEYVGRESSTVAGRDVEFLRFDMSLAGIKVEIWADAESRIFAMKVPVQHAAFVREGYGDLLNPRVSDPLLSKPEHEVRRETVMAPARDGVKLATDIYLPAGVERHSVPVILVRTPYKKEMSELTGQYYARRGYAVAIQDCRGRFGSAGTWEPFMKESADGYDAVEWLAEQPWSTGKVGMIGGSYVGWVQLWAAAAKPPHLVTIIPNVAPPDPFYNLPYEYGTFFIYGSIWWAEILESEATGDLSGKAMEKINEREYEQILKQLPVIDLDRKILGKENPYWRRWIEHNANDAYWQPANFMDKLPGLEIPVFLQSGWFDGDGIGSKLNYLRLKQSKNPHQKLVLGPWGHTDQSSSRFGERDFGPQAAPDLQLLYLRWFDRWLKGVENGVEKEPLVKVFVMSANRWLEGDAYPLPRTRFTDYYLSSESGANTSLGDGRLSAIPPRGGKAFDAYTYDPGDPTPYPEWYFKTAEEKKAEKEKTLGVEEQKKKLEAYHAGLTDRRPDILVYQTEPLAEPLTIAGPVSAVLYASSSAPDTDWFVSLMDVDEKGSIFQLVHGTIRARFRKSMSTPELLKPKEVYEYAIDMWQTGIRFERSHRIRIEVASCAFPMFSRNLNTGGHNEKETRYRSAKQKIFHSPRFPSHLILPVIPEAQ